jgi:hypothetical protein
MDQFSKRPGSQTKMLPPLDHSTPNRSRDKQDSVDQFLHQQRSHRSGSFIKQQHNQYDAWPLYKPHQN